MKRLLAFAVIAFVGIGSFAYAEGPPAPPAFIAQNNAAATPTVVQVTPPKSDVLFGDYAAAALQWMLPILAPVLSVFIVDALIKIRQHFGETTSDAQREKLLQMAENGVNLAGHNLGNSLVGKLPIQTKSEVMAMAVDYIQAHGADTIKALGLDPTDPKTVQALQGRIATILANKESAVQVAATPVGSTSPKV